MRRASLLLLLLLPFLLAFSQATSNPDTSSTSAKVNVIVTDMKGIPTKGEQVLFKNETTGKTVSGISDVAGRFNLLLAPGYAYLITVKSFTDSAKYGRINIPALQPGEFFTEPFKVNVKFEAAKTYTLDNVHFDVGKASLRPESFVELTELVSYLNNKTQVRVEIAGHTDNSGTNAENLRLSQQRAETIRNYLVKKGIQPSRIVAKGYGSSQPVAGNDTEEGKQQNRRTEVRVL